MHRTVLGYQLPRQGKVSTLFGMTMCDSWDFVRRIAIITRPRVPPIERRTAVPFGVRSPVFRSQGVYQGQRVGLMHVQEVVRRLDVAPGPPQVDPLKSIP